MLAISKVHTVSSEHFLRNQHWSFAVAFLLAKEADSLGQQTGKQHMLFPTVPRDEDDTNSSFLRLKILNSNLSTETISQ